jgi:predicted O-methyltransferase YrrM
MNDWEHLVLPPAAADILRETIAVRFINAIDQLTGALLRALAASKPGGRLLELGTGTGLGTAWLLDGMDAEARLTTVEVNPSTSGIAQRYLGHDPRVEFIVSDAEQFLAHLGNRRLSRSYGDKFS